MVVFLRSCGGVLVLVFLWWCLCGGVCVVVFVLWCFCGGVFVVMFLCLRVIRTRLFNQGCHKPFYRHMFC